MARNWSGNPDQARLLLMAYIGHALISPAAKFSCFTAMRMVLPWPSPHRGDWCPVTGWSPRCAYLPLPLHDPGM